VPSETQRIIEFCVGRVYSIVEIDENGLYVLDVSSDIDSRFGGRFNDLRVEAEFLERVSEAAV
jgi:hypothetical protein